MKPSFAPISPSERIRSIDILRGFAVFGILSVNMAAFRPTPGALSDGAVLSP